MVQTPMLRRSAVLFAALACLAVASCAHRDSAGGSRGTPSLTVASSPAGKADTGTPSAVSPEQPPGVGTSGSVRCTASVLRGELEAEDPGAGQRHAVLVLTNTGTGACTLYGYGGLVLVDDSGTRLPTDLDRVATPGPALVRLAPGNAAGKNLNWSVVSGGKDPVDHPCQPSPARTTVTPPDEAQSLDIPWPFGPVCSGGHLDGSAYYPR